MGASKARNAVLAVGAIMVDMVCCVPALPTSGEGVVVESSRAVVGGCAFNSANAARQLGADCTLFAPVGEGIYAGFVEGALAQRGLQTPLRVKGRDNGSCTCLVEPDGQRTMITSPSVERYFERSWFDAIDAAHVSCGLASGYEIEGSGGNAIIEFFEEHPEIQFFYAPGPRILGVGPEKHARINALRPIWHLNDQEALAYTGCSTLEDAARVLATACENAVVITAGAAGSFVLEGPDACFANVATEAVRVVDTVGAGDAHLGALAAARAAGRSWKESLELANKVASGVCAVEGATLSDEAFARLGVAL